MARGGDFAGTGREVEHDVHDGRATSASARLVDQRVQVPEHRSGAGALERVRAQRVADLAIVAAASSPRPPTSPITIPIRPSGSRKASYAVTARVVALVARHVPDRELVAGQLRRVGGRSARWSSSAARCSA